MVTNHPVPAPPSASSIQLEALVAEYEMAPRGSIMITPEGGQLYGQATGTAKQPLVHISGASFAVGRADGPNMVKFILGADGRATALVMRRNGNDYTMPRVR